MEKLLGPEWYRLFTGLVTNPLSVAGILIIAMFLLIAAMAPVLAPPTRNDPYQIPVMAMVRSRNRRERFGKAIPPDIPFWYTPLTGNEEWVHLMGTTSGQFDIWYGIIWGTRTAIFVGLVVVGVALAIGLIVGVALCLLWGMDR